MSMQTNDPAGKRIWILILVFLSVFCIIFFSAKNRVSIPLTNGIVTTLLAPFQSLSATISNKGGNLIDTINKIVFVYDENRQLKNEVSALREQNLQGNELAAENQRLKSLLDYKSATKNFDLVVAVVIARDPATWVNNVVINRGSNDGIEKDMPVVTPEGLVGSIIETYPSYSIVGLVTDPRISVGALVQRGDSRVAGIVKGDINKQEDIHMDNLPRAADVQQGDQIITSGLGGIYPKGISIGTVEDVQNESGGLLKYAVVEPAVDFQKLEDVAVVVSSRELPPEMLTQQMQQAADGGANSNANGTGEEGKTK
ncbi:rod shape-determining protein MreC [Pectinatus cerevisiiphilus]|uniref:Cell shape-determining protein MreC n=1 Tax=Pectinatus cerevisiiphilus TaxID=86956 RepID=A0A4R3KE70_9FIRM|nr:rod shape-determining protein MreC [Pectinatus cerevisiiphilus]TCS81488.1 rod shape-determining protein MreC [Pectinatus cerevisiiphilus]